MIYSIYDFKYINMNKISILVGFMAAVVIIGAGCNNNSDINTPTTNDNNSTSTPTSTTSTPDTSTGDGLTVTVNPMGGGKVQVNWTVPENFDRTNSIRVLHSGRPDSDRPFYFQYMNTARSTELNNVPTGKRYFKVCEYKNDQYGNCSEQIEVEVL